MNREYSHGPVYGKVTDNADPDSMGRVKVMIDHLGETIETGWIPVLLPVPGMFILPEIEDQVIVSFIGDSPEQGIVLGTVWSNTQMPPETGENTASDLNKDGENNLRFFHSRAGHKIILDDKSGEEKIQMITSDGGTRYEFMAKESTLSMTTDKDLIISAATKVTCSLPTRRQLHPL